MGSRANFWDWHQECTLDSHLPQVSKKFITLVEDLNEYGIFSKGEYGPNDIAHDEDGNVLNILCEPMTYEEFIPKSGPNKGIARMVPTMPAMTSATFRQKRHYFRGDDIYGSTKRLGGYYGKNAVGAKGLKPRRVPVRSPDKLLWVIHREDDGTRWLYKPALIEKRGCESCYSLGTRAYECTGMSDIQILQCCCKSSEFNANTYKQPGRRIRRDIPLTAIPWCVELDGKNIMAALVAKPKMTYAEIVNIIKNEGGTIDSAGIVHRPAAD